MNHCELCSGKTIPDDIPIKSNANLSKTMCVIAQGSDKKEIVFIVNGTAYGIEINNCPFCGRVLPELGW